MIAPSFLDALEAAARAASAAEDAFRREIATRTKELERQRAFAFRRLNFMRAVAEAVAKAESEEGAASIAAATLRARLGWASDSEARTEVHEKFAPVAIAMFEKPDPDDAERPPRDVLAALAAFEAWYEATHPAAFWALFENIMPETPVVDF